MKPYLSAVIAVFPAKPGDTTQLATLLFATVPGIRTSRLYRGGRADGVDAP